MIEWLLRRYGSLVAELFALIDADPRLVDPVEGAPGYLAVEVVYAAAAEGALHLDDVLSRRTRIAIETRDRGVTAARAVADLVGPVLGWSAETAQAEIERYERLARIDYLSEVIGG